MIKRLFCIVLLLASAAIAQVAPQPPRVYINTTWHPPTGGATWSAHTSTDLKTALAGYQPGDVIELDAGVTYSGNFHVTAKANPSNKWLYIVSKPFLAPVPPVSAGAHNIFVAGTRVNPTTDAKYMAKLVTANAISALTFGPGVNYVRLVGVELYSASTHGANPTHTPWPINPWSYNLITAQTASHITIDRCYLHGSDTQDLQEGFLAYEGASYIAIVDSVISDVHETGMDSQAFLAYGSNGPFKLVNNELSASTEDVMFGGAGAGLPAPYNGYVTSDIEIRNNHFYKPLYWLPMTTGTWPQKWVVKNHLEFKEGQRVLVDNNLFENVWTAGQGGTAIVLTVRTSQSGNNAVDDDITITNNVLKNMVSGFSMLASDYACGSPSYPNCTNPGESKRVLIKNNLFLFGDPALLNGGTTEAIEFGVGTTDWVFQHNTMVPPAGENTHFSIFFHGPVGVKPPYPSTTHNVWILDNVLFRQPTGDNGRAITEYMGDPDALGTRLYGNVVYVPVGEKVQTSWPVHNYATTVPLSFDGNYRLVSPSWTDTTDGKLAGVN